MNRRLSYGLVAPFFIWAIISTLFFCTTALASPTFSEPIAFHSSDEGFKIEAAWVNLENKDDAVEIADPRLKVKLANFESEPLKIIPRLSIVTNGKSTTLPLSSQFVGSNRDINFSISIPPKLLQLDKLKFSGRLLLSLDTRLANGSSKTSPLDFDRTSLSLPRLYFHPQGQNIKIYREDVLRKLYRAGNFQGLYLDTPDPRADFRKALAQTDLSRVEPILSNIHQSSTLPGTGIFDDVITSGLSRFCLAINGVAFVDSDFEEDFGKPGEMVPLSRGWVTLGQQGDPLYTGFLDTNGCSPAVAANREQEVSVAFFPLYLNIGPNIRGFVSDLNLGPEQPGGSMPWELFFIEPEADDTTVIEVDDEYMYTIFAAAANSMERARGGLTNVLYEFRLREEGDNTGTATNYAAEGHPQVGIKFSPAAEKKFTISHEYGHALHIAKLNPPFTPNDLDYTVETNGSDQGHTINSKEWQLTAAFEGFAHFVAGLVWNDAVPDEGAVYGRGSEVIELDDFDRVFETNFNPAQFPNQGIERDWAQFFWNYRTDEPEASNGNTSPPTLPMILETWLDSYQWPVNGDFLTHFRNNGVPGGNLQRFDAIAESAGVDH